jgi:hypothetical protein
MLLSIVLILEAMLVFFVTLTVYGVAFGGGALLLIILVATTQVLRFPWGMWIGWALQVILVASGLILPALYIVAALFVAMWVYCFIRGQQIDRQKSAGSPQT